MNLDMNLSDSEKHQINEFRDFQRNVKLLNSEKAETWAISEFGAVSGRFLG